RAARVLPCEHAGRLAGRDERQDGELPLWVDARKLAAAHAAEGLREAQRFGNLVRDEQLAAARETDRVLGHEPVARERGGARLAAARAVAVARELQRLRDGERDAA